MPLNFGAGPAALPKEVLEKVQSELLSFQGRGLSILELSHRSEAFGKVIQSAEDRIKRLLGAGEEWTVLFMQGGGTLQFAAAPMNLVQEARFRLDYIVTGQWSKKAAEEARMLGFNVREHAINVDNLPDETFDQLKATLYEGGSPKYVYFCDNETIDGIEFPSCSYLADRLELDPAQTILVSDMSSNFLSRPISLSKFGLIFATAQKNIGPAGVTVVLVRRSLLQASKLSPVPKMLDYSLFAKNASLYNTPPVFSIYVTELVLAWLDECFNGSLQAVDEFSRAKSNMLYQIIDASNEKLINKVPVPFRSRMNVIWQYSVTQDENTFKSLAKEHEMLQLEGHRSVGGMRASLYNAITLEQVEQLASLIQKRL